MTKLLLSLHVLAAILAIGPVAVAASMFPAVARRAASIPEPVPAPASGPGGRDFAGLRLLHRICRVYALLGVAVPVFGLATASSLGVLTDAWLLISIALTLVAAVILAALILPGQRSILDGASFRPARLGMLTGIFNLLWAVVVVLMIVRPGSTTGA